VIDGVVFDLDGVLLDSEQVWDGVREQLVRERGGSWHDRAQRDMMGMSSLEWSRYMHDELGLRETPEEICALLGITKDGCNTTSDPAHDKARSPDLKLVE